MLTNAKKDCVRRFFKNDSLNSYNIKFFLKSKYGTQKYEKAACSFHLVRRTCRQLNVKRKGVKREDAKHKGVNVKRKSEGLRFTHHVLRFTHYVLRITL
jgi:hypothetical protein